MNLFRSEEHVQGWERFEEATSAGIIALPALAELFAVDHFRRRLESDYFSSGLYADSFIEGLRGLAAGGSFWAPGD